MDNEEKEIVEKNEELLTKVLEIVQKKKNWKKKCIFLRILRINQN